MASTLTPEARELALVGKVEMRIALADSDKKLQDLLNLYLSPLLLKLNSDSRSVRDKVCFSSLSRLASPSSVAVYLQIIPSIRLLAHQTPLIAVFSLGHIYLSAHQHPHKDTVRLLHFQSLCIPSADMFVVRSNSLLPHCSSNSKKMPMCPSFATSTFCIFSKAFPDFQSQRGWSCCQYWLRESQSTIKSLRSMLRSCSTSPYAF